MVINLRIKEIKAIKSELELIKKQDKEKQEAYAKEVESRGVQKMKQDFSSNIKLIVRPLNYA